MPPSSKEPSFPSYNESIHLSKEEDLAKVVLQTSTTISINTSNDDKDSDGSPRSLLLPVDSILISIMDRYGLDSLTLSVSSSSSVQYEYSGNHQSGSLSFPVGTAVQYSSSVPSKDDSRKSKKDRRMETQMEYELMQLLSSKNLFCENVQLEPLRSGHIRSIEMPTSTNGQCDATTASQDNQTCSANNENEHDKSKSKEKIIMLPREAYSLCQTRALWDKIISSAPCRDRAGIYSYLQRDLNGMDIFHKMSWVRVNRQLQHDMDANNESSIQVNIDKGLAFTRWLEDADDGNGSDNDSNEAEHVSLSALLAGEEYYYDDGRVDTLKHCPLSDSSKVIVQDGIGDIVSEHDLTKSSLDVSANIDFGSRRRPLHKSAREIEMGMIGDDSYRNIQQSLGIERNVVRLNGISNRGMLQTRVYQSLESSFAQKCGDDSDGDGDRSVVVSLVDVFPKIIIPVYHSMRIFVVEGMGSGDEFHAFDPEFQSEHSIDGYSVTQYNIRELDHKLTLTPNSDEPTLETLSLTMVIPEDSSIYVQVEYEPRFLSFEEFPADPNRGFDVPPSIATFSCNAADNTHANANSNTNTNIVHAYSNALLIMPPVPDLSMPFNVISITSTFLALILGTLINILIRKATGRITDKLKSEEEKEKEKSKSKMTRLKGRVKTILKRVKGGRKVSATASKEVTNSNCDMDNGTHVQIEKGQETLKRETL